MPNSLVIGGTGFIGRRLVHFLLESGRSVRVMSRGADPQMSRRGVEFIRGAISQPDAVLEAAEGIEEVFHLATGGGSQWADFERDFLDGTRHVLNACRRAGARRLIFTSSTAALYLGDAGVMRDPAAPDGQPEKRANYGRAKALAERIVIEDGFPSVILRPAIVVGRGSAPTHSGVGFWPSDLCCIGWGTGNHRLPFVLVDDVAQAMVLAGEAPGIEGKSYNLAGDVRPTAREYIRLLAERSLRRYQFYPRSVALLQGVDIGKWLIKIAARKAENPFPSFRDLKSRSFRTQIDCSAAKEQLGWRPNADYDTFVRDAIDANIRPVPPGDLRLSTAFVQ